MIYKHLFPPLQEAARRYTDTSWQIFNQNFKKSASLSEKNSNGNTYQKLESTDDIQSASPISSFSNGSITKSRETTPKSKESSPLPSHNKPSQNDATTSENESVSSIFYEKISKPESKQIVKIETVEVSYEPVKISDRNKLVRDSNVHRH